MQDIQRNYDNKAQNGQNFMRRQHSNTYDSKAFNNWVKAVLINKYTKQMCSKIQKQLDLPRGQKKGLLHVLDIGCGRGQDIKKWRFGRINYMVAMDFSKQCIKQYEKRWEDMNHPYKLYTLSEDFTNPQLYNKIQHSYYDIVSAQLSFHYMFSSPKSLKDGLSNILSNLLVGGLFVATVPDSYTIIKKISEKGLKDKDGNYIYGNKYFSMKFNQINFSRPFGNQYGFYLQEAVGNKNEQTGQIQYTQQWLISLDDLQKQLITHGVQIEYTANFIDFYKQYRQQYKDLFSKFKLTYEPGKNMQEDLWQIVHLYRVLICRKKSKGKSINEFNLKQRNRSTKQNFRPKPEYKDHRSHSYSGPKMYDTSKPHYSNNKKHYQRRH